jgi:long-chain fatty acid transport protein
MSPIAGRNPAPQKWIALSAVTLTAILFPISPCIGTARAGNGLNLIGFGAESYIMGGADLAVARDTSALNTNPSGLTQIEHHRLDLYSGAGFHIGTKHEDEFGNDQKVPSNPALLANLGYAQTVGGGAVALGIGVFAQGGSAFKYDDLNTAFGTEDDLSIRFRVARITPGIAWDVNPDFSVGASLLVTYSDFNQKVFPETSFSDPADPNRSFFGFELKNMDTVAAGGKFGVMYRLNGRLRLGAAYTTGVRLKLDGGTFRANMSAVGLGKVKYRDVTAKGLDQPQEFGIGLRFDPNPRLLLSVELTWIDWSTAVRQSTLTAKNPDNPAAPSVIKLKADHNWRDQYVVALGFVYEWTERFLVRGGYNYGRNPIPDENLNPLLAMIPEHHLMAGAGYRLTSHWRIDGGVEYIPPTSVTYTNPNAPFGADAKESAEFVSLSLMASLQW